MYKKLLSLLILLITIIILIGNFIFFNFLLEKKEEELIKKTGRIELSKNDIKSNSTDISLINIIKNVASSYSFYGISHQPFENQLSMKEAVQISKSTIIKFIQNGIILDTNDIKKKVANEKNYNSNLSTRADNTMQLNPLYSLWSITCNDDNLYIHIYLNATTGDVLYLSVHQHFKKSKQNLNIKSAEEVLNLYLEYLKLEYLKTDFSKQNNTYAKCKLKDTNVYLTVAHILDNENYYLDISFYK